MNAKLVLKSLIACVALAAIVAVAGADLFPATPTLTVIAYAGCAIVIVLALLAMAIVIGQGWNQFGLNHGGTDPKWMWFGGEPPGLQKERENSAAQSRDAG
ncbi:MULTISPECIES: hypothetical protein [Variovorax]|uniref:hypothetical protein n=1 Tax=Variovorax TaxID=34072 RepID=UPI003D649AFC